MAINGYMMNLGGYTFKVNTAAYQQLVRRTEYRWASNNRLGNRPSKQYVGPGEDTITLSGVIYPGFSVASRPDTPAGASPGIGQIAAMRYMAEKGQPLTMVSGTGIVFGRFVIMSIEETASVFFSDGTPQKQEFTLELAMYGEEPTDGSLTLNMATPALVRNRVGG